MDGKHFDQLMREWFTRGTRRGLLQRLSALPLAAGLAAWLGSDEEGEAKKRQNRRQSRHRRHQHKHDDNNKNKNNKKGTCTKAGGKPKPRKPCCKGLTKDQNGVCASSPPSPPPGPPPPPTPGCSGANPCPNGQLCDAGSCVACDVCATGCPFSSIQAAIDDASQPTTIRVCAGTYNEDLTIGRSLTLRGAGDGNGVNDTIVDGSGTDSVLTVTAGTIVLQRLRITGGDMPAPDNGGGVNNTGGADLTLDRCTVIGNHIPGDSNYGGGVFNDVGATLHLTNCTVTDNDNDNGYGAGVANLGTATIDDCIISSNGLNSPGDPYGVGIYNGNDASLSVTDSTINDNVGGNGVGVYNDRGAAVISTTQLTGNASNEGDGAGIYSESPGTLTVSNCTIANNTGARNGGGIISYDLLAEISDTEISGHTVVSEGGGLYFAGDVLHVTNCTISNNTVTTDYDGGGVYVGSGTATITGGQITGNSAPNGGGIDNAAELEIDGTSITGNLAVLGEPFTGSGGGIYNNGTLTLTDTTVTGNTADTEGDDILNTDTLTCASGDTVGECVDDVGASGCDTCAP